MTSEMHEVDMPHEENLEISILNSDTSPKNHVIKEECPEETDTRQGAEKNNVYEKKTDTGWKISAMVRKDIISKIEKFDEMMAKHDINEQDLFQNRMEKLQCAPIMDHFMQLLSEQWKESNNVNTRRCQDDIDINNLPNIINTEIKIKLKEVTLHCKKRHKVEKRLRKEARSIMKKSNIRHEYIPSELKLPQPQEAKQRVKRKILVPIGDIEKCQYKKVIPEANTIITKPDQGEDSDDSIIVYEDKTEILDEIGEALDREEKAKEILDACMVISESEKKWKRTADEELENASKRSRVDELSYLLNSLQSALPNVEEVEQIDYNDIICLDDGKITSKETHPFKLHPLEDLSKPSKLHYILHRIPEPIRDANGEIVRENKDYSDQTKEIKLLRQVDRANGEDRCTVFATLGLNVKKDRSVLKRKEYIPIEALTIEQQHTYNKFSTLHETEIKLARQHIIQQYGNVPLNSFNLPSKYPYDGLYWPLFQPIDAVDLNDQSAMINCDVQNQLVNHSICNYAARKYLLCDENSSVWERDYKEGYASRTSTNRKPGRFKNRVCYARKVKADFDGDYNTEVREMKERERRAIDEHDKMINDQIEEQKRRWLEKHNIKNESEIKGTNLTEYTNMCKSTRLNAQLRSAQKDTFSLEEKNNVKYKRRKNPYKDYWFKIPKKEYVPANDRRTFLCKFVNHYNHSIVQKNPGKRDVNQLSRWIAASFTAAFAYQADVNTPIMCFGRQTRMIRRNKFIRLTLDQLQKAQERNYMIDQKFHRGGDVKLKDLIEICKMQDWEWDHWPLIWDSLSSIYKRMPPVSQLVSLMANELDEAFCKVACIDNRPLYYKRYTDAKNTYLEYKNRNER